MRRPDFALEIAWRRIGPEWGPQALGGIAHHLPDELLRETFRRAAGIPDRHVRARVFGALGPRADDAQLPAVLEEIEQIPDNNREQSKALIALAPRLNEPLLRRAMGIASTIADGDSREAAIAGLLPRLAELGQHAEAFADARRISRAASRARALTGMLPHLPDPAEALEEALEAVDAVERGRQPLLAAMIPHLLALPPHALRQTWSARLHAFARGNRATVVEGLTPLVPVIVRLGGTAAADQTALAIMDVWRWWP